MDRVTALRQQMRLLRIDCFVCGEPKVTYGVLENFHSVSYADDKVLCLFADGFDFVPSCHFHASVGAENLQLPPVFTERLIVSVAYYSDNFSYFQYSAFASLGAERFIDVSEFVDQLLYIKNDYELFLLRCSARLNELVLETLFEGSYPVSGKALESRYRELCGAFRIANCRIAVTEITENLYSIDSAIEYSGYYSDITRMFSMGSLGEGVTEDFEFLLDIHRAIEELVKPDMYIKDLFVALNKKYSKNSLFQSFLRGFGHGIGLAIHESYSLFSSQCWQFKPGMTFTLEPILTRNYGNLRIENMYCCTDRGLERLHCTLKDGIYSVESRRPPPSRPHPTGLNSEVYLFDSNTIQAIANLNINSLKRGKRSLHMTNKAGLALLDSLVCAPGFPLEYGEGECRKTEAYIEYLYDNEILV